MYVQALLLAVLLPFGYSMSRRPTNGVTKSSTCGVSTGCFSNCKGTTCGFVVTWVNTTSTETTFTFAVNVGGVSSHYAAIGFSTDDKMGDDSVIECTVYGGQKQVHPSWNEKCESDRLDLTNAQAGLSSETVTYQDGILSCSFKRQNNPGVASVFDINKDWRLMFATGPVEGEEEIEQHEYTPWVSDGGPIDLQSFADVFPQPIGGPLIKAHGTIMILAWMICSSFGMLIARYYKKVWHNQKIRGMAVWFQVHRALMIVTSALTVIGFILILIFAGGKLHAYGHGLSSAHPILGLIVMILALVNPLGALFRPNPTHKLRPVFNILHMLVAIVAQILTVLTLCGGVLFEQSEIDPKSLFVVIGYALWHMVVDLVLILLTFIARRKDFEGSAKIVSSSDEYDLRQGPPGKKPNCGDDLELWAALPKKIILVIHGVVASVFTLALIILLLRGYE